MVLKGEDSKRPQAKAWCKEWGAKPQDEPGFGGGLVLGIVVRLNNWK